MKDTFLTIAAPSTAEFRDRGSKFLAYASPVADERAALDVVDQLRREHPKANHHCYAYRLGLDQHNYRANDDGEPSGTAGRPILGRIDSRSLTQVCVVVVRYFGGTLLGTSGLINAYKSAAESALDAATVVERVVQDHFIIHFDYALMSPVMNALSRLELPQLDQDFGHSARIRTAIRRSEVPRVLQLLRAYVADIYPEEVTAEFSLPGFRIEATSTAP
jgi:uncharacterized YigZ family protein